LLTSFIMIFMTSCWSAASCHGNLRNPQLVGHPRGPYSWDTLVLHTHKDDHKEEVRGSDVTMWCQRHVLSSLQEFRSRGIIVSSLTAPPHATATSEPPHHHLRPHCQQNLDASAVNFFIETSQSRIYLTVIRAHVLLLYPHPVGRLFRLVKSRFHAVNKQQTSSHARHVT
jgi:hypothetical protein